MIIDGPALVITDKEHASWVDGRWSTEGGVFRRIDEADPRPTDCRGWITPGFVDGHCHVGIGPEGAVGASERARQIRQDLESGVLALRDCGVPVDNSELSGAHDLPVLMRCGRHIARAKRYIRGLPREVEPADLPDAVAAEAARGDGWVKIVGDWIDRSRGADSDLEPLWPREALIDAVAAAHEAGARVAVHSFSHKAIDDLLAAGVDDIEHASGMDEDQMAQASAQGTLISPTLLQVDLFASFADLAGAKYPVYAATMRQMYEKRREHAAALFESGVRIVPGTDSGGYQEHGILVKELEAWVDLGVEPHRVFDIATWQARQHLGFSPLHEGQRADLLVFDDNPQEQVNLWRNPRMIVIGGEAIAVSVE